jgi:hypothetical protein
MTLTGEIALGQSHGTPQLARASTTCSPGGHCPRRPNLMAVIAAHSSTIDYGRAVTTVAKCRCLAVETSSQSALRMWAGTKQATSGLDTVEHSIT